MELILFFGEYWSSALVVLIIIAGIVTLSALHKWDLLDVILFKILTESEKLFASKTGAIKLAYVIEQIYPHIPVVLKLFISPRELTEWIERSLTKAKARWAENPHYLEDKFRKVGED